MSEKNTSRSLTREVSRIGNIFQCSTIGKTVNECKQELQLKIAKSTSEVNRRKLFSKLCLIEQLQVSRYLPLHAAYDEYRGMLPIELHSENIIKSSAQKDFQDSILASLPVLIVNISSEKRYVMLYECNNVMERQKLTILDTILSKDEKVDSINLDGYIRSIMDLLTSSRERAIIICTLALIFSPNKMRDLFDIRENDIAKCTETIIQYTQDLDSKHEQALRDGKSHFHDVIAKLEENILVKETKLQDKMENLHEIEKTNQQQDLSNMKNRLINIKLNERNWIRRVASAEMRKWKMQLMKQYNKGYGKYRIDRGAELAVFNTLQEQMVAHARRKGIPEVQCRLQRKELRYIANKYLEKNEKRLIKSYETVRSWAKPRNKRSIQRKQHRGKNLYCHRKPQKKFSEEHINVHYNRAHIKYYTRMLFSSQQKAQFSKYAIRRCIDDKAYLRCGTSEGFGRPSNIPIAPVDNQPHLPAYDFPEKVGYVAPGVNLIISDMNEIEHNGKTRFTVADATISVTCKPKAFYSSSATQWFNDIYRDRIAFPKEHEIPMSGDQTMDRQKLSSLILLKDSMKQFCLMNIKEDYLLSIKGGDYLKREELRLTVLIQRLLNVIQSHNSEVEDDIINQILFTLSMVQELLQKVIEQKLSDASIENKYEHLQSNLEELIDKLHAVVPQHKSIDIQTSDAGPGVGTSERMVRHRLVEDFLIHDMDLQARMHYAPRDSKTHLVEQVMSYLTDAAGDGRHISPTSSSIVTDLTEKQLLNMSSKDFASYHTKNQRNIAFDCAEQIAARYQGKAAMNTTINARVPKTDDQYQRFYFDEEFIKKCLNSAPSKLFLCAGSAYSNFIQQQFQIHYIRYDNGVEGIRKDNQFRCPHNICRIAPPVPNLDSTNERGVWHYHTPNSLPGNLQNSDNRSPDDFCPRAQLNKLFESVGQISLQSVGKSKEQSTRDVNLTWNTIQEQLPEFIHNYVGADLEDNVRKEAEKIYIRNLLKSIKGQEKPNKKSLPIPLYVQMQGNLKLKIGKKRNIPSPLPWNGILENPEIEFVNSCTVDNMLYFFHLIQTENPSIERELKTSTLSCMKILNRIHHLFEESKYPEGKYLWLKQIDRFKDPSISIIDSHGSEDEFFFRHIWELTSTTYQSTCSEMDTCLLPVSTLSTRIMSYSLPNATVRDFQDGVNDWLKNDHSCQCTKTTVDRTHICGGTRTYSPRQFVTPEPIIIPFEVNGSPWATFPEKLKINNISYELDAQIYGNGGHFCASLRHNNKWFLYDGLKEYHSAGHGLRLQGGTAKIPNRYHLDYVIYLRIKK